MKTIIVSGPIGSGKSFVCGLLREAGIPVFDCDSEAKKIYAKNPRLAAMATPDIFEDAQRLSALENGLFPLLMDAFRFWARERSFVAMESATILQKPYFDGFGDYVLLVDAPAEERRRRVMERGGISQESLQRRMALQSDQTKNPRVSFIIDNSRSKENTMKQLNEFLKSINYGNTEN